jgi:C1A family cysteine protease
MKHLRKKSIFGISLFVFLVSIISVLFLNGVNRGSEEKNIQFTPDDTMRTLQLKIEAMRNEIKQNGDTFEVGINSAMQYSIEQLCTFNPDLKPDDDFLYENTEQEGICSEMALPSVYTGPYTPIKDAGYCGTSWAFATVGVLEGIVKRRHGIIVDLSEQYLLDCNTSGYSCNGGYFCHYMHMSPNGSRFESCYPYTAVQGPCWSSYCPYAYRISSWAYVGTSSTVPTVSAIKQKIYDYGSVAAGVYVDTYFQAYTTGCFSRNAAGNANHCIILIGWDDTKCTTGAWRLKNDWGTAWGESGFMWIKYGVQKVGYAANYVVYP